MSQETGVSRYDIRREKVGEAEVRGIALLLTQTRYPTDSRLLTPDSFTYHDIIPIAIGIKQLEEAVGVVFPFQLLQDRLSFLTKAGLLGGVLHLPGEVEIGPVDVGSQG